MDLTQGMVPVRFLEDRGPPFHPQWCTGGLPVLEPDPLGFKSPFSHLVTMPLHKFLNHPMPQLPPLQCEGNNAALEGLLQE